MSNSIKKLLPKELEKAQRISSGMRNIVQKLANLEIQKHNVLKQYDELSTENKKFEKLLSKKYGDVIIDPTSGEMKTQEQLREEAMAQAKENEEPKFVQ